MVEKGIREGICHSTYQYAKSKNKYIKDYEWMGLYGWDGMDGFIWMGNVPKASSK